MHNIYIVSDPLLLLLHIIQYHPSVTRTGGVTPRIVQCIGISTPGINSNSTVEAGFTCQKLYIQVAFDRTPCSLATVTVLGRSILLLNSLSTSSRVVQSPKKVACNRMLRGTETEETTNSSTLVPRYHPVSQNKEIDLRVVLRDTCAASCTLFCRRLYNSIIRDSGDERRITTCNYSLS